MCVKVNKLLFILVLGTCCASHLFILKTVAARTNHDFSTIFRESEGKNEYNYMPLEQKPKVYEIIRMPSTYEPNRNPESGLQTPLNFPETITSKTSNIEKYRDQFRYLITVRKVHDTDRRKRNINNMKTNEVAKKLERKQKKVKTLGRLLMNSVSNKNDVDSTDDYNEEEDDDYSRGMNRQKMKWEDYQNEDGASVMELIALNARHKTNNQRARQDQYLY